ncbi:MAG TPA: PEP/pyruvate-binding domain-containing protein, partial [Bacteroidia bacterium]
MEQNNFIKYFDEIRIRDVKIVGGKNASLGEMFSSLTRKGINVPYGFAATTFSFWEFIYSNQLKKPIAEALSRLDKKNYSNLKDIGQDIRGMMLAGKFPEEVKKDIIAAYKNLCKKYNSIADVAVRSSATAEDLPFASFAGLHESFLNIRGEDLLISSIQQCYASLFTDRAIKYREENKINHTNVALSVGVQKMVRSDMACSGIAFTIEPESGFKNIIHIAGSWGLGENIVQGNINPDEYLIFKPTLIEGKKAIVSKKLGTKAKTMIYSDFMDHDPRGTIVNTDTPLAKQEQFILSENEIIQLAQWALIIEHHYEKSMDMEWAKDGLTGELFIVQARPETVHRNFELHTITEYKLKTKGKTICKGSAIGSKIASGVARILHSPGDADK